MKKALIAALAAILCQAIYSQPRLRPENLEEILSAMTLEEKATLCVGSGWGSMMAGSLTASDETLVPGAAGTTRAIPRMGIPQTVVTDGPAGVRIDPERGGSDRTYYATGFPVGTVLASTWNTELVQETTSAMGNEVREYGADVLLAPGMNIHRNPLCGRNFEYFSEDPFLTGKMAAAYVNGIQSNGVGVSIKHFAANSQETNRMENDVRINPRALREIYLRGFEIAVKESAPWTVMSSYNKLNGEYTQQSRGLLTTILRDEWGYEGIVMTDWGNKAGTVAAVHAGNDLMEPGDDAEIQRIISAVKDGTLPEEELDRNVRRILSYIVRTPRYNGYSYSDAPDLKAHAATARKAADEGMVLLENNGILPLKGDETVALYGVGSYDFIAGGTGSGNVNKAYVRSIYDGLTDAGFRLDGEVADWYGRYVEMERMKLQKGLSGSILVMGGDPVVPEMDLSRKWVASTAGSADVAIFTISRNAGENADRRAVDGDWTLSATERSSLQILADEYHSRGKKLVVVLNIGGVIETASWKHIPDAILLAWTPGQEGGDAVADLLSGKVNPSGKLPVTFPMDYFDIPSSRNYPYNYEPDYITRIATLMGMLKPASRKDIDYTEYAEGIWVGYRYFSTTGSRVSYPFGYGLSYTVFEYSKPVAKVGKDGEINASITIKNVGSVSGKEVVEVYVQAPDGGLVKPAFELKGFGKTGELAPGESETISFTIDTYSLASFNEDTSAWETATGSYEVLFGASSADIRTRTGFKLSKSQSWPVNRVCLPEKTITEISIK